MLRTKVYRARKHKSDISIQLNLTKKRYNLLKEAHTSIKDVDSVEYAFADGNFYLGICFKNFRFTFFKFIRRVEHDTSRSLIFLAFTFYFLFFILL